MRYLIVTGDDLGLSPGVNRGIIDANEHGILTSASLIVNMPWSKDAALRIQAAPGLSVGLHANLAIDGPDVLSQLCSQLARFEELVGRPPAHIDSHHDDHRRAEMLPHFLAIAEACGALLRGHSGVASITSFYGRWDGESHPEQISVEGLVRILEAGSHGSVTELACHPGYVDDELPSSYASEREIELATLCDARLPAILRERNIALIGTGQAPGVLGAALSRGT